MTTIESIKSIAKELSHLADQNDYQFVYGELLRLIMEDFGRHGVSEKSAPEVMLQIVSRSIKVPEFVTEEMTEKLDDLETENATLKSKIETLEGERDGLRDSFGTLREFFA